MRRTLVVTGPRGAGDVWDRYVRPARWPEWSPQIRSVDYRPAVLTPDTIGVVHGPAGLRVRFRIRRVDAGDPVRSWSWSVRAAGVRLWLRHTVEPAGSGARTTLTIAGWAPAVVLYAPAARWALHRLVH